MKKKKKKTNTQYRSLCLLPEALVDNIDNLRYNGGIGQLEFHRVSLLRLLPR